MEYYFTSNSSIAPKFITIPFGCTFNEHMVACLCCIIFLAHGSANNLSQFCTFLSSGLKTNKEFLSFYYAHTSFLSFLPFMSSARVLKCWTHMVFFANLFCTKKKNILIRNQSRMFPTLESPVCGTITILS